MLRFFYREVEISFTLNIFSKYGSVKFSMETLHYEGHSFAKRNINAVALKEGKKMGKVIGKAILIGMAASLALCIAVTFILNNGYKKGVKGTMELSLERYGDAVEKQVEIFTDAGGTDKDELYNKLSWFMNLYSNNYNDKWFGAYNELESGNYFFKMANGIRDFLATNGLLDNNSSYIYAQAFSLKDVTDNKDIGATGNIPVLLALWDEAGTKNPSYAVRTEDDGTERRYSLYSYKPSSKTMKKLMEWKADIDEKSENNEAEDNTLDIVFEGGIFVKGHEFVPCKIAYVTEEFTGFKEAADGTQKAEYKTSKNDSIDVADKNEYTDWDYISEEKVSDKFSLFSTSLTGLNGYLEKTEYYKGRIENVTPDAKVTKTVHAADGHDYEIKVTGVYDIFKDYGKSNVITYFCVVYCMITAAAVVIALIFSIVIYKKRAAK